MDIGSVPTAEPAPPPAPSPMPHPHLSQPVIPDFPCLDLFAPAAAHADPVVSGALSFSTPTYSMGFPSSTVSTFGHQLPSPVQHGSMNAAISSTSSTAQLRSFASAYNDAPPSLLARSAMPVPVPSPAPAPISATVQAPEPASVETPSTPTEQPALRRRKSGTLTSAIDKDKLEERRRKNRLSSSKCYYNRKKQIEEVEKTLQSEKRRAIALYQRELDLRNENARLKKQLVLGNVRIPSTFLTTTRTESFGSCAPGIALESH